MRKIKLFHYIIICMLPAYAFADNNPVQDIKSLILKNLKKINTYTLRNHVSFHKTLTRNDITGITGKKLRIEQVFIKPESSNKAVFLFDGKSQWINLYHRGKRKIYRIKLNSLVTNSRPFDTGYYLLGSGLLNGEDYPSTIKSLLTIYRIESRNTHNKQPLTGKIDKNKFTTYSNGKLIQPGINSIHQFMKLFPDIKLIMDKKHGIIKEYSLGNPETGIWLKVTFEIININSHIDHTLFTHLTGKSPVTDITEMMLKHKQSNK